MTPFASPYAARFVAAYQVSTAREIFAYAETHPITPDAEWPVDVYANTGDPAEDRFILAVPSPEGLVAFFATTPEDAERIRASVL